MAGAAAAGPALLLGVSLLVQLKAGGSYSPDAVAGTTAGTLPGVLAAPGGAGGWLRLLALGALLPAGKHARERVGG